MRTTLDIEDALIEALMARHPGKSKTEAIEMALRAYLAEESAKWLMEMAGKLDIEDVSGELRRIDRHT